MTLSQSEADALLKMSKQFIDTIPIELSQTTTMDRDWDLLSKDKREKFILTIERGRRKRIRLKYQTRAREVFILARLDLDGPKHQNPPNAPYKPGEWLVGSHIHLYREGFETRIAYELSDIDFKFRSPIGGLTSLEDFLHFCNVTPLPAIQQIV